MGFRRKSRGVYVVEKRFEVHAMKDIYPKQTRQLK